MYVIPFNTLKQRLNIVKKEPDENEIVEIPYGVLKLIMQLALAGAEFDEASYLDANPDVVNAVATGEVTSARMHFVGYGYFEGRSGVPKVDERWYLANYPDVAAALSAKRIRSASEHFYAVGAAEGRSPNGRMEQTARQWKKAMGQSR